MVKSCSELYIDIIKKSLIDSLNSNVDKKTINHQSFEEGFCPAVLEHFWRGRAKTFSTLDKLDKLKSLIEKCLYDNVPGDLIECGVWRGGTSIFMKAVLIANKCYERKLYVADSFQGLPEPKMKKDKIMHKMKEVIKLNYFSVSMNEVKLNFDRYGLLDKNIIFLKGWFKDTLLKTNIKNLSILRIDCDYYNSTMDVLENLYNKLSVGGYVILDDYYLDSICCHRKAVDDFRKKYNISEKIKKIDWQSVYWRKK